MQLPDLTDPTFLHDPYPALAALRAAQPLAWDAARGIWWVTRHADVVALLRDRRLGRALDGRRPIPADAGALRPFFELEHHSLMEMEPPDHTRLRALLHKAFTPRRVAALEPQIAARANRLLDALVPAGGFDLLADFAAPLTVGVIADLLGVPATDWRQLLAWSHAIVKLYELRPSHAQQAAAVAAIEAFAAYLRAIVAQRRAAPADDLISALVLAENDGDRLSEAELIATCILLLNAGHEATVNALGNGFNALLRRPDQRALWQRGAVTPAALVDELLRYDAPLQLFKRVVREPMVWAGHAWPRGTQVALLFGAANRDPAVFADPDRFDLTRDNAAHVAFGGGIHYCLGAPLARLELTLAAGVLLARLPGLRPVAPAGLFQPTFVLRGLQRFDVVS